MTVDGQRLFLKLIHNIMLPMPTLSVLDKIMKLMLNVFPSSISDKRIPCNKGHFPGLVLYLSHVKEPMMKGHHSHVRTLISKYLKRFPKKSVLHVLFSHSAIYMWWPFHEI